MKPSEAGQWDHYHSDIIMESDDENLIIPPEHLNLSDEPELQLSDEPIPGPASGDSASSSRVKAAAVMDTEWDTFQMSIARSGPSQPLYYKPLHTNLPTGKNV